MRDEVTKLDYVGFTFNGLHSSQFGINSVSSGNRYQRNLLPDMDDSVMNINGQDGSYFFGSNFKTKSFPVNIAFDTVTEQEFREMSRWLYNNGNLGSLIFDELPYIEYFVKVVKSPSIKYLTFEDSTGARVHKGEGQIEFIAYSPYGYIARDENNLDKKWLSDYDDTNLSEWAPASGLLPSKQVAGADYYDTYASGTGYLPLYNPGDCAVDFLLTFNLVTATTISFTLGSSSFTLDFTGLATSKSVTIDTKKRLVTHDGTHYSNLLSSGSFFKIPIETGTLQKIVVVNKASISGVSILYSYRYL